MSTPRPTHHVTHASKPGAALIAELEQLRDSHRLGLHMWECAELLEPPDYSLALLSTPAEELAERLGQRRFVSCHANRNDPHDVPATSLSLLPDTHSGLSMMPYESADFRSAGFLMDLRQDQPNPPRILRVSPKNLNSNHHSRKSLTYPLHQAGGLHFHHLYRDLSEPQIVGRAASAQGPKYGAEQLDALGHYYRDLENNPGEFSEEFIVPHNEVIACASRSHLKAIVQPYYFDKDELWEEPVSRLCAALGALQSHENGLPLPCVMYQVGGPEANGFTYLGGTEAELTATATKALRDMAANPKTAQHLFADDRIVIDSAIRGFLNVPEELRKAALTGEGARTR